MRGAGILQQTPVGGFRLRYAVLPIHNRRTDIISLGKVTNDLLTSIWKAIAHNNANQRFPDIDEKVIIATADEPSKLSLLFPIPRLHQEKIFPPTLDVNLHKTVESKPLYLIQKYHQCV